VVLVEERRGFAILRTEVIVFDIVLVLLLCVGAGGLHRAIRGRVLNGVETNYTRFGQRNTKETGRMRSTLESVRMQDEQVRQKGCSIEKARSCGKNLRR
jgi:hypothetical protein